ncbi:MAG: carbohydrate kinase [Lachnospiraceae bacterium]|nr:carbohydrate kinase [Lachnospiraceae bacterium]
MGKYLVGIDEGTMGCKTCIFDLDGNLIAYDYREYRSIYPAPGRVEQDPLELTEALYVSCKTAIKQAGIDPKEILGLGLSTQGGVIGPADKNGEILGNFIGWQDTRCTETKPDINYIYPMDQYYEKEGWSIRGSMHPFRTYIWLKENDPEFFEQASRWMTNQEYFLRKFGVDGFYTDASSACREGLADTNNFKYSEELLNTLGIDVSKKGEIVCHGTVVGHVNEMVAERTGLAVGTPVCVAALDQDCSTFGAGLLRNGDVCVVMGTLGACYVASDKGIRDKQERLIVKSHTYFEKGPNTFTIEAMSTTSASALRWYRDQISTFEKAYASMTDENAYDLITKQAEKSEAGARGVTFLPYMTGATARQNSEARGTFTGIRLDTKQADLSRAVLEGISYEMLDIIRIIEQSGVEINTIRLVGGPVKSPFWCQVQADIYQRPVIVLQAPETGCLGAALFAGIGVGVYKDAYDAVDTAVKVKVTYEPNPEMREAYEEGFRRYLSVYEGLSSTGFGNK